MKGRRPQFPPRPAEGGGETKTPPRGSKIAPRALKDPLRGRQRPLQAVPRTTPEALGGPISSPNPLFSNVLNKLHFLIKICIGSFQEAIKKIQELPKINMSESPSFQVSMPLSLQASECYVSSKNELLENQPLKRSAQPSYLG